MQSIGFPELLVLLGFLVFLVTTVFWVWALVDCAKNETDGGNQRALWLVVIVLTHWIGAAIYFLVRRPQRIREGYALRPQS